MSYQDFLRRKSQLGGEFGFAPTFIPSQAFDFQAHLIDWNCRMGRSANFADCGLGKTLVALGWCENVIRKTNKAALIITPLAVGIQTAIEADKFGIEAKSCRDGKVYPGIINIINYQRLHYLNPDDFSAVYCDESSALKAFDGKLRKIVTRFLSKVKYRLLGTATAAPNDYIELGTSSEALGIMGQRDMLSMFFRTTDDVQQLAWKHGDFWNSHKWLFKAHSETPFWRWVCSWARAVRRPSDLGDFDDSRFQLPALNVRQHVVENVDPFLHGELFARPAVTLREQRDERRATIERRCEKVAELVANRQRSVVWCQLNQEGEMLADMIPGAFEVAGRHSDDEKEERLIAFTKGEIKCLVTKPKIGAWGLNWQHIRHATFFPSHSFEEYYQAIRRMWRFGQQGEVDIDIVTTEGESGVTANLMRKADAADRMFAALVAEMHHATKINRIDRHANTTELPSWL